IALGAAGSVELTPRTSRWRFATALPAFAVALAVTSVAAQPAIASWYAQRGITLEFTNQYDAAAAQYRRALAHDATNLTAHFNLVRTLAKEESWQEAWLADDDALRWDSGYELRIFRSRICRAQHD